MPPRTVHRIRFPGLFAVTAKRNELASWGFGHTQRSYLVDSVRSPHTAHWDTTGRGSVRGSPNSSNDVAPIFPVSRAVRKWLLLVVCTVGICTNFSRAGGSTKPIQIFSPESH